MIYIVKGNETRVKEITGNWHNGPVRVWINGVLKVEALPGEVLDNSWDNWMD
jgi:hypothetical protein